MANDRKIAGIRCMEVLALLPDYLEDRLEPDTRDAIEAHLRACDWCASFGGRYADTIHLLRQQLLEVQSRGEEDEQWAGRILQRRDS